MRNDILKKILEALDKELVRARNDEPYADHVEGKFEFGRCEVIFFFNEKHCDVEVNRKKGTDYIYLDKVAEYCSEHCIDWADIEVDGEAYDLWDDHGFRDEADYMRYRYG